MKNISDEIVNSLSLNLREKIKKLPKSNLNIEEIRLRSQKPLILNANNKDYFYNEKENDLALNMDNPYIVTREDIEQTFQIICKYSIHTFMDDITKGFITLRGGHRVGIVGKAIVESGQVKNIKHISSLNIRISREIIGCSDKILDHIISSNNQVNNTLIISPPQCGKTIKHISSLNIRISREIIGCSDKILDHIISSNNQVNNTLIISPPQCGKTTLVRDIVRNLSNGNKK